MRQYLEMIKTILEEGTIKPNRTGIDTLSYFAYPFRHDLRQGFPLLTTKKMDGKLWNSLVYELLWFLSGENHTRNLSKHTKIWDAWADKNGNLETAYGWYWRNFPCVNDGQMMGGLEELSHVVHLKGTNFDQLSYCVEQLKSNPNNRRLIVSAWEPFNAHKSKLPPCHLLYIFNVQGGRLCLQMTQRSCDSFLGIPFNIASYALLTHIIAHEVGLEPGILSIMFVDAHIYYAEQEDKKIVNGYPRCEYDHSRVLKEQIKRKPYPLSQIKVTGGPWDKHSFEDFTLLNYSSHERLKALVAV